MKTLSNETKILAGIFIATLLLLVGGVFFLSKNTAPAQKTDEGLVYEIDYSKGYKIGSDSAKVRLVEFSDFQCPACMGAEPTIKDIISTHGDQVQFVYRHFPLPQHFNAEEAANAAEEAGAQGKFWEYHDRLFATQDQWESLGDPTDFFVTMANELQLDGEKVREAIKTNKYQSAINDDKSAGQKYQVNSTPTFFLNGRKINLIQSTSEIKAEVEKALNQ